MTANHSSRKSSRVSLESLFHLLPDSALGGKSNYIVKANSIY